MHRERGSFLRVGHVVSHHRCRCNGFKIDDTYGDIMGSVHRGKPLCAVEVLVVQQDRYRACRN